mmetsp:Transcript_69173/g.193364  ORF Transcript_69173/g.193364 Transcript_69173/m.193364 type:complete len:252 (+) Transcript_69173:467-1222(+)
MSAATPPNSAQWSPVARAARAAPSILALGLAALSLYQWWRPSGVVTGGYVLDAAHWRYEIEIESFKEFTETGPLVPQRGAFDVKSLGEEVCPSSGGTKEMYEWSIRRWDADEPIVTSGTCSTPQGGRFGVELCEEAVYRHPYWGRTAQEVSESNPHDVRETARNEIYQIDVLKRSNPATGGVDTKHTLTVTKHKGDSALYLWAHWQRYLGRRVLVEESRKAGEGGGAGEPRRVVGLAEDAGWAKRSGEEVQ